MIIAKHLSLQEWNPGFSSLWPASPAPKWTRLKCDGIELSNSIEFTDWKSDLVSPILCEQCLGWDGWWRIAHLVRTDDQLLWMQPYYSDSPALSSDDLVWRGVEDTILIDRTLWDEVSAQVEELPGFESIRRITLRDLWALWWQQLPLCCKPATFDTRENHFRWKCIASHPIELEEAVPLVLPILERLEYVATPLEGRLEPIDRERDMIQAYYFDDDETSEWLAFTIEPPHSPVIANQWILRR